MFGLMSTRYDGRGEEESAKEVLVATITEATADIMATSLAAVDSAVRLWIRTMLGLMLTRYICWGEGESAKEI